jgi:hypothetical protein
VFPLRLLGLLKDKLYMMFLITLKINFKRNNFEIFAPMAQEPLVGHGLLMIEASRSHSDTPHSVGLLWRSDQPVAETST